MTTSPYPNRDVVPGELYARLKAELERTQAVLADLIESKQGAEARGAVQYVTHYREVKAVLDLDPARNEDGDFTCCSNYGWHSLDCAHMALWKAMDDPRYQSNLDDGFKEYCRRQEREERTAREAAEYAAHGCTFKNSAGTRCSRVGSHPGMDHYFPIGMGGMSALFRELYSPTAIENLAYERNPFLSMMPRERPLAGLEAWVPTSQGGAMPFGVEPSSYEQLRAPLVVTDVDRENKVITVDQAPSLIVSPFVKEGSAYLFQGPKGNQIAVSPHDASQAALMCDAGVFGDGSVGVRWDDATNPVDAIKRAKEALDKMNGRKP